MKTMVKSIGFQRNIYRTWLDAAASAALESNTITEARAKLDPLVLLTIASEHNRRMAIDILINIWIKNQTQHPQLYQEALALYSYTTNPEERMWLHYGMTLLCYPFFRTSVATLGRMSTYNDSFSVHDLKRHLFAELGQLGGVNKATERIVFSLRNWGILAETERKTIYAPKRYSFSTPQQHIERWMIATVLTAHPAQELTFADIIHLPELFPFRFSLSVDNLRSDSRFEIHRQGLTWDMVSLTQPKTHKQAASKPANLIQSQLPIIH